MLNRLHVGIAESRENKLKKKQPVANCAKVNETRS